MEPYVYAVAVPAAFGLYFLFRRVRRPLAACGLLLLGCLVWTGLTFVSTLSSGTVNLIGAAYYMPLFAAWGRTWEAQREAADRAARRKFALDDEPPPPPPPTLPGETDATEDEK